MKQRRVGIAEPAASAAMNELMMITNRTEADNFDFH